VIPMDRMVFPDPPRRAEMKIPGILLILSDLINHCTWES